MVPARESGKEPPGGEAGALESTSNEKEKKKARVGVSIRKGNLLFFPTVLTDEPEEPELGSTKVRESEGN